MDILQNVRDNVHRCFVKKGKGMLKLIVCVVVVIILVATDEPEKAY